MDTYRSASVELPASRVWHTTLIALGVYALWLAVAYWDTLGSMVSIWYRSDTFAHGFLVAPICAWLVWRRRHELARTDPTPALSVPTFALLALAGAMWFAGELADVLAARQFAWVTMLVAGVWVLAGNDVARRLMFPLGFLYFAVPIGEFMLPTLVEWTANFTIAALRLSGVPVWREGMTFHIPTGAWSVVEACSGLRYLIASVTVGVLYAHLAYRSPQRRAAFVLASIGVPIVANWLRAYMIVMIGHLSDNKLAVGIDHIIYGWIFFGVVMMLLFWVGSFWREDDRGEPGTGAVVARDAPANGNDAIATRRTMTALCAAVAITAVAPAAMRAVHGYDFQGPIDATPPAFAGWRTVDERLALWKPELTPPRAAIDATYAKDGAKSGLYVALYYGEDRDSKLVSTANQLVRTADRSGYLVSAKRRTLDVDGVPLDVDEAVMKFVDARIVARRWYWVDGVYTASAVRAKLLQARARLTGRGDAGAIVVVFAIVPGDSNEAPPALEQLTRDAAVGLRALLAQRFYSAAR